MGSGPGSVLILGGGINGAAIARELTLNGVGVCLVDSGDVARGATSYSSRLIHGGLRYLEYGDFSLVRESLGERERLLRLAPQFVKPLELFIPIERRFGGLLRSAARFAHLDRLEKRLPAGSRGLWLVEFGLGLYDRYAQSSTLPWHRRHRAGAAAIPPVDPARYRWLCSYYDAQIRFPERFVLALLHDARSEAARQGVNLEWWTYHQASLVGSTVEIRDAAGQIVHTLEPAAILNATGAWVDATLAELQVASPPLMGGTKGSHLVTHQPALCAALGSKGIYAEAADGRPVFILPLGDAALIGTTDLPYTGDPADAVASPTEIDYLIGTVNHVLPGVRFTRDDITLHYSGVRPLPASGPKTPSAVTRRHWIDRHEGTAVPTFSIIGGKLTTCRSLAEQTAELVLESLGRMAKSNSRERTIPGGEDYPADASALAAQQQQLAVQYQMSVEQIARIWPLLGTSTATALTQLAEKLAPHDTIDGTPLPVSIARWSIEHERARRLDDLVERRLMLLYDPRLSRRALEQLAGCLSEAGHVPAGERQRAVDEQIARLRDHFGLKVQAP